MKRRITALILVVVMLALTLVSCGYSYAKDDMTQYATFDKTKFAEAILNLEIEDGEYTTDETTRQQKIIDHVYEILLGKVDTTAKVTTGAVGERDKFFYCYYVTADIEGTTHAFLTSNMKEASALSLQFGNTGTEGYQALLEAAFKGVSIDDMIYKTDTSSGSKAANGQTAYISYTADYYIVQEDGTKSPVTENIDNEPVIIGDANHDIASKLDGKAIATTLDNITKGEGEAAITYSNIKINWVVSSGTEKTFTEATYTEEKKLTSANDGKEYDLNGKTLTYHVYPVYYLEVEDYNAKTILKTLISDYITETTDEDGNPKTEYAIPSFEEFVDDVKKVIEKEEALNGNGKSADEEGYIQGASAAYEAAKDEKDKDETSLNNILSEIKAAEDKGEEPTETQLEGKKSAEEALNGPEGKPEEGSVAKLAAAEAAKNAAEEEYESAIDALIAKIGEDKIKEEYEVDIHETLLEEYNAEIKKNLATKLWEVIQEYTEVSVDNLPEKAVKDAYDRIYSNYQYLFYNGTHDDGNSSTTDDPSNYSYYEGVFEEYLRVQTGTSTFEEAKDEVMNQAKEHVLVAVTVFAAADAYDLTLTKDELKELGKTANDYLNEYYGENNVQTAEQFDKLMNHFLSTEETDETTGVNKYPNIGYTTKD